MINVHGLRRNMKNVVKNYSDAQIKVREATSNDPWGPSGTLMSEIADLTYNVVAFSEIMQVLWKRLNDHGKNWKHVYKALVLLEYLLKSGSERVAFQCKENVFAIETLKDFQHVEDNKDHGINVREKAKQLVALLKDEERLKNERRSALKARERFASSEGHSDLAEQDFGSSYSDQPTFDKEILSSEAVFVSDLERVRPQTAGEEELQLQLALAMSKEEADQEERIKRNDELRLQMALSESRETYEKCQFDTMQKKRKSQTSAMDDLLDVFTTENQPPQDPWASSGQNYGGSPTDIVASSVGVEDSANSRSLGSLSTIPVADSCNDMSSLAERSPDLISSSTPRGCYDFSNMKKSISTDSDVKSLTQENCVGQKFLGENAKLVNFEVLVETPPATANPYPSLCNPFQTRPIQPSINEIRGHNSPSVPHATLTRLYHPQFAAPLPDAVLQERNPSMNPFM